MAKFYGFDTKKFVVKSVEELEFLRGKNFFSGSGISLNEVIERNCAKWKRIVGNDNFIIYKDVGELKNHHELSR